MRPLNRINFIFNAIWGLNIILSLGLFLTFLLLLTVDSKFIAFNEFSSTGKYPAIFFFISILLVVLNLTTLIVSMFGAWATNDILNQWCHRKKLIIHIVNFSIFLGAVIEVSCGVLAIVYMKAMPQPLRVYMSENLRSNYTGGLEAFFIERQFDKYVDWVQINYQCCGVISHEDYRNGYYYNTYNKYQIVNVVPNSCCIYRSQAQQVLQCQMKSVNIYRKGCYDILMFWMETYGAIIASLTIVFGLALLVSSFFSTRIAIQIDKFKRKENLEKSLVKFKVNNYQIQSNLTNNNDVFETGTIDESLSYVETKT